MIIWDALTPEQKAKVIEYNCSAECIRDDAWEAAFDFQTALKAGQDAIFMTYESLIDWWNNCDDETQSEILEEPVPPTPSPTTGS